MLNRKISFWTFQFNQMDAFAEYLEQQAQKGWFIDCRTSELLSMVTMKRGEPRKLKFSVVMIPNVSEWESEDSSRILEYREMCEQYGWNYVGSFRKYRIFLTECMDTPPIETDSQLWFDTVGKRQITRTLPCYLLIFCLYLFQLSHFFKNPSWNLVKSEMVWAINSQIVVMAFMLFFAFRSLFWYLKTRRAIENGETIFRSSLRGVKIGCILNYSALLLLIMSLFGMIGSISQAMSVIGLFVVILISIVLCGFFYRFIKRHDTGSDGVNRIGFYVAVFFVMAISLSGFNLAAAHFFRSPDVESAREELNLPVDPEVLGYQREPGFGSRSEKSYLASVQGGRFIKRAGDTVEYRVTVSCYEADFQFVYRMLYEDMRPDYGNAYEVKGPETEHYGDVTVERYDYRLEMESDRNHVVYVMQKNNLIMQVNFFGEEDEEFVKAAVEGLISWRQ